MSTDSSQKVTHPVICKHATMPRLYQWCHVCHLAYWCCTTCMHLHRCDTCTQQQAAAAGKGEGLRQGGQ